jgi:hypothetical protein
MWFAEIPFRRASLNLELDIVKADHGDIAWHLQFRIAQSGDGTDRRDIVEGE